MYLILFIPQHGYPWLADYYDSRNAYLADEEFPENYGWEQHSAQHWRLIYDNELPLRVTRLIETGATALVEVITEGRLEYYASGDPVCPGYEDCLWDALCSRYQAVYEISSRKDVLRCLASLKNTCPAQLSNAATLLWAKFPDEVSVPYASAAA